MAYLSMLAPAKESLQRNFSNYQLVGLLPEKKKIWTCFYIELTRHYLRSVSHLSKHSLKMSQEAGMFSAGGIVQIESPPTDHNLTVQELSLPQSLV
jgi:hypothetical protein